MRRYLLALRGVRILAALTASVPGVCGGAARSTAQTAPQSATAPAGAAAFEIKDGQFLLDGRPFQIISGEMHYARIPPQYWRHRLRMAKACGLNTIATYVFWNMQEPEKGKFNFKGNADIAKFIRTAKEEGLFVILRPGPYVCAEWDFGGFPYWLLNEQGMKIRTNDPRFIELTQRYFTQLGKQLVPLEVANGGNILMVQVENEYGSYGSDKVYMGMVRDAVLKAGFKAPLFMCDGGSQLASDYLTGLLPGENGGSGPDVKRTIDRYYPGGPYFVPEYYPGWLDHWGEPMVRVGQQNVVRSTQRMLASGISFNYYMFHGGTNFGFTNGANFGSSFEPDITSYDYDAPLDEAGRATPKYMAIRGAIQEHLGASIKLPDVPPPNPSVTVPKFELTQAGSLLSNLPRPVLSDKLLSMEDVGQDYGFILYRTVLHGPINADLQIKEVRDYAVVMVNGRRTAIVDRRVKSAAPHLTLPSGDATLDILVENCGRINYGGLLLENRKGITESVTLGSTVLTHWSIYPMPLRSVSHLALDGKETDGPTFRRGRFVLSKVGDTYLDMHGWNKGVAFINGHNLGRFWTIGPQQTLYVPAPWLKHGENEVTILDLEPNGQRSIACADKPQLDELITGEMHE